MLMPAGPSGLPVLPGVSDGVVRLLVGGMLYEGFEDVEVRRSMKEMAGEFTIHVTQETGPATGGPTILTSRAVKEQDPCQVFYGSVLVLTGYVDAVQPRYSKTHHSVTLQGRSKTGDLADSSVDDEIDGGEMRESTLGQIATKATRRFGVGIKIAADVSERIDVARVNPGETVHRFLERYARSSAVALTDDQMGNLRLLQSQDGSPVTQLIEGVNILEASSMIRADKKHSQYTVKGQDHGRDGEYGDKAAQRGARSKDTSVSRHRPLTLLNDTKSVRRNARSRAAWEAAQRAGESLRAEVKVVDWCYAPGQLWMPGLNAQLTSPMLYVNRVLTIQSVVLRQSRKGGTQASLTLVPPEAENPKPVKSSGKSSSASGSGGGGGGGSGGGSGGSSPTGTSAPMQNFGNTTASDAAWTNTKPTEAPADLPEPQPWVEPII